MVTSKQINYMATHPVDMIRFQATGKMPRGVEPHSPLITLLESIGVRNLGHIIGLTVDSRLGYSGQRTFSTAAQALHWIKPTNEVFGSFPAEEWRIKNFVKILKVENLIECCTDIPEAIRLRNSTQHTKPILMNHPRRP